MKIDACFKLGSITGTRGLTGEVTGFLDTDQPDNYKNLESVFVQKKGAKTLIPFFIEFIQLSGDKVRIKFEEVISKDDARQLIGSGLFLPLDQLPQLQGDSYYFHELVNWTVWDEKLGRLGTVSYVNLQSPQPLLVMEYRGHEVLVPAIDGIMTGINRDLEQVNVSLPEGLLDVYLNDQE